MLEATGSALQASFVMILNTVAASLLGPFAGALVDHWDRKKTVIVFDVVRAAPVLCIPVLHELGVLEIWHIYVAAFVLSSASLFSGPARASMLPNIVGKDNLVTANVLFRLTGNAMNLTSKGIGGVIIAALEIRPKSSDGPAERV